MVSADRIYRYVKENMKKYHYAAALKTFTLSKCLRKVHFTEKKMSTVCFPLFDLAIEMSKGRHTMPLVNVSNDRWMAPAKYAGNV